MRGLLHTLQRWSSRPSTHSFMVLSGVHASRQLYSYSNGKCRAGVELTANSGMPDASSVGIAISRMWTSQQKIYSENLLPDAAD